MVLSVKRYCLGLLTVMSLILVSGCSEDEPAPEETPQPVVEEQPDIIVEEPPMPPMDFSAEPVFFDYDDYSLSMSAQEQLNSLADHMRNNAGAVVQIEGHCDERGSQEYNLALGERRAQSVKNYLSQMGIDDSRLTTISYGEEKPIAEGSDESAWSQNRRAEFILNN